METETVTGTALTPVMEMVPIRVMEMEPTQEMVPIRAAEMGVVRTRVMEVEQILVETVMVTETVLELEVRDLAVLALKGQVVAPVVMELGAQVLADRQVVMVLEETVVLE